MLKQLKVEILEQIKTDADLYSVVTKALGVTPASTNSTLTRNSRRLTEYAVLEAIANYTGKNIEDLTEDVELEEKVA